MKFNEKDFETLRNFCRRVEREFGTNTYVGTDNATLFVEYSPELKAMLRPLPPAQNFDFELKLLSCLDCKKNQLFLCLPTQEAYLCDDCATKRKQKGVPKEAKVE